MNKSDLTVSKDSAAMKANSALLMAKMEIHRDRNAAEEYLIQTVESLEKALEPDPYWADYFLLKNRILIFYHEEFGCKILKQNNLWPVQCIGVSNALHIPGISLGETFELKCSICGEDPMNCPHTSGKIYDGRLALEVVKNLEFNHVAILINQIPEERHVGLLPRPLTDEDIKDFFHKNEADRILKDGMLRCKDLIRAIRKNNLGGMNFVHHPLRSTRLG